MDRYNGNQYPLGPTTTNTKQYQNDIINPPPGGCPPCPPCPRPTPGTNNNNNGGEDDPVPDNNNTYPQSYPQGMYTQMGQIPPAGMYQATMPPMPPQQRCVPTFTNAMQPAYMTSQGQQNDPCCAEEEQPSIIGFQAVKLIRKICRKPPSCGQRKPLYQPPTRKCGCIPSPPMLCSPMRTCRSSNFQNSNGCSKPAPSSRCRNNSSRMSGQTGRLYLCRASDSRDDQVVLLQEIICEKDNPYGCRPGQKTTSVETHFANSVGVNTDCEGVRNNSFDAGSGISANGGLGVGSNISAAFGPALNALLAGSSGNDGNGNLGVASALGNMFGLGAGGLGGQSFDPALMAALAGFGGYPGLFPPGFGPMPPFDLDGRCDQEDSRQRKDQETVDQCDSCDSFERWRLKCECRKKMREDAKKRDGGNDAKADAAKSAAVNTSDSNVAGKSKSSGSVKGKKKDKKGKKNKKKR